VSNPQKAKGDRHELAVCARLAELLDRKVVRALGAGRAEDTGDVWGIDGVTVQLKNFRDLGRAIVEAIDGADRQAVNAGTDLRLGVVRRHGARHHRDVVVMSLEQFAEWVKAVER
jgi:hypothetical protein